MILEKKSSECHLRYDRHKAFTIYLYEKLVYDHLLCSYLFVHTAITDEIVVIWASVFLAVNAGDL